MLSESLQDTGSHNFRGSSLRKQQRGTRQAIPPHHRPRPKNRIPENPKVPLSARRTYDNHIQPSPVDHGWLPCASLSGCPVPVAASCVLTSHLTTVGPCAVHAAYEVEEPRP